MLFFAFCFCCIIIGCTVWKGPKIADKCKSKKKERHDSGSEDEHVVEVKKKEPKYRAHREDRSELEPIVVKEDPPAMNY